MASSRLPRLRQLHLTPNFREGIGQLCALAIERPTAILCAEAVWWRCHRSMVADYLKAEGWHVYHILSRGEVREHPYTSVAGLEEGRLTYRGLF